MTTAQQYLKRANKKSRLSYFSQTSKKSLNHKDKISTIVKTTTLKKPSTQKCKKQSKSKPSAISNKQNVAPYLSQTGTCRKKSKKIMNTISTTVKISNTVPIKYAKQKFLEFPFEAIKFKQKTNQIVKQPAHQSKTHDNFFGQPQESQHMDLTLIENSKKIVNSFNQRVNRYNQYKSKKVSQISPEIKDQSFLQAIKKLFKFMDSYSKGRISHSQIDWRKLPQGALYFLGGIFQKIRQKHISLSEKQFQQQCAHLYIRSSNDDIKWFVDEIKCFDCPLAQTTIAKRIVEDKSPLRQITNILVSQESKVQERIQVLSSVDNKRQNNNNFSFEQQNSVISFRKQNSQGLAGKQHTSMASYLSQVESYQSAKFGIQTDPRISFKSNGRQSFNYSEKSNCDPSNLDQEQYNRERGLDIFELTNDLKKLYKTGGIKKNLVDKTDDLRDQIYEKLNKMKIIQESKENNILKQNFKQSSNLKKSNLIVTNSGKKNEASNSASKNNCMPLQQIRISSNLTLKQKLNVLQMQEVKSQTRNQQKQSKWIGKNKNCENTFSDLQKIKDQFKRHKQIINQRQQERQNYFKQQINKVAIKQETQDSVIENQSRIVKLFDSKCPQQNILYEKNIDRLNIISKNKRQNNTSINLNETLTSSCRKSVQISLPLKYQTRKTIGLSSSSMDNKQQRYSKLDKIDELSQKLESYLRKNALKIEYSKNITESTGRFSKILN